MPLLAINCLGENCTKGVRKGVFCSICKNWAHRDCSGLKPHIFELYRAHSDLVWVCTKCQLLAADAIEGLKEQIIATGTDATASTLPCVNTTQANYAEIVARNPMGCSTPKVPKGSGGTVAVVNTADSKPPIKTIKKRKNPNENRELLAKIEEMSGEIKELKTKMNFRHQSKPKHRYNQNTVLILNDDEPMIKLTKARKDMDRRKVQDVLRIARIPPHVPTRRVHRVGKWNPTKQGNSRARPILVEFVFQRHRDELLAKASRVQQQTKGRYRIEPEHAPVHQYPVWKPTRDADLPLTSNPREAKVVLSPIKPTEVAKHTVVCEVNTEYFTEEETVDWVTPSRHRGFKPTNRAVTGNRCQEQNVLDKLESGFLQSPKPIAKNGQYPRPSGSRI